MDGLRGLLTDVEIGRDRYIGQARCQGDRVRGEVAARPREAGGVDGRRLARTICDQLVPWVALQALRGVGRLDRIAVCGCAMRTRCA